MSVNKTEWVRLQSPPHCDYLYGLESEEGVLLVFIRHGGGVSSTEYVPGLCIHFENPDDEDPRGFLVRPRVNSDVYSKIQFPVAHTTEELERWQEEQKKL